MKLRNEFEDLFFALLIVTFIAFLFLILTQGCRDHIAEVITVKDTVKIETPTLPLKRDFVLSGRLVYAYNVNLGVSSDTITIMYDTGKYKYCKSDINGYYTIRVDSGNFCVSMIFASRRYSPSKFCAVMDCDWNIGNYFKAQQ